MAQATPNRRRVRPFLRRAFRVLEHGFAALGVLFLVYHLAFDLSAMVSPSMSPTLRGTGEDNGDWVLTERISYLFRDPKRWEVVAFRKDDGLRVMKRVIGLPGETVSLLNGVVMIGGSAVGRPESIKDVRYYAYGNLSRGKPASCEGGYYVLGDDSKDSEDSRFEGPVKRGRIGGRAWLIVWPPSRIRLVSP